MNRILIILDWLWLCFEIAGDALRLAIEEIADWSRRRFEI